MDNQPTPSFKETIKLICRSLKPALDWAIKKPGNALRVAFQMVNYLVVVLVCLALLNLSKSGFMADFRLFGKDDNGNVVIGEVITDKTAPVGDTNKNLLMMDQGLNHRSIGYGRKVFTLFGYHAYGTVKWTDHNNAGNTFSIGITVSF